MYNVVIITSSKSSNIYDIVIITKDNYRTQRIQASRVNTAVSIAVLKYDAAVYDKLSKHRDQHEA